MTAHRDVLVVDDDTATRVLLETLFARAGLAVIAAGDGDQALTLLGEFHVGAIVLDLFMPRSNGTDLLAALSQSRQELLRRVIILSAAPETLIASARQQYPIWCAMRKPADISDLLENVLDCLLQEETSERHPARISAAG